MAKIEWEEERELCSAIFLCCIYNYVILEDCGKFSVHVATIEKPQN